MGLRLRVEGLAVGWANGCGFVASPENGVYRFRRTALATNVHDCKRHKSNQMNCRII